ncbi:hypothetical protein [Micromonospora tulbaghiae]
MLEFRQDVVRVARHREPGVTTAQIAKGFEISNDGIVVRLVARSAGPDGG